MTDPEADAREALFRIPPKFTWTNGSFTFDEVSGAWTYTLDNSNDDASALTAGQVVDDALTAISAEDSSSQVIDIRRSGRPGAFPRPRWIYLHSRRGRLDLFPGNEA